MVNKIFTRRTKNAPFFFSQVKPMDFDYPKFRIKNRNKFLMISVILFFLFLMSLFKNISYPLLWADESATAIGSERVIKFGYPKVHDGKNVFYDLPHSNPRLGIKKENDAYIAGAGWGLFYYGTIGYRLAEITDDIYLKTGIYRATFAIAGLFGVLAIGYFISMLFPDKFSRYAFISLFLLLELLSVSLALLLREVRYYSLVVLLTGIIIGLYCSFRFNKPFNKILFAIIETLALWLLFNVFSPVYFIIILSFGLSELIIAAHQFSKSNFLRSLKNALPVILSVVISFMGVYPLLSYFKTFEISNALNEYKGYNFQIYLDNLSTAFNYFKKFEFLLLAIVLKILLIFHAKKLLIEKTSLFKVSGFLTLFFIVSLLAIAKIPQFLFTRYIIFLQPFLSVIIILDFFTLLRLYSIKSSRLVNSKVLFLILVFSGMIFYTLSNNLQNIKGHIYEMTHIYKGPLDFTIPFIMEKFQKTDTLIIAANYEETSYMYYLKSKVIVGYVGNNIMEDSKVNPHVIAYRKSWMNFADIFDGYYSRGSFESIRFPIYDNLFNNIPEFNFMPSLNHQFKMLPAESNENATYLYIRK